LLACFANPQLATEMLAPIRNQNLNAINLHRSKLVGSTAASRSSNATTSNSPLDRLAAAQPPHPRRLNPHSQPPRVHTFPFPRFPPLEVFRRRPPEPVAPSASGRHPKTFTITEVASSFDHLVGAQQQGGGDGLFKLLRGFEIDNQLEPVGLLDR
jgi:hypothetical protein